MTVKPMPLNDELAINIIELLESAREGAKNALDSLKTGDIDMFARIMADVQNAIIAVQEHSKTLSDLLSMSQCFNIIENIFHSVGNMADKIIKSDNRRGEIILEFEIIPLLAELKEDVYFFALIYPDKSRMDRYYKEEFAKNHQNEYIRDGKVRYDVSLVVTAWNKLDYTKLCIESLLKFTDIKGLNCELITINHGSHDGTGEYFESLPHEKKINFKKNMGTIVNSYFIRAVEGKYCVFISNDVVLTKNWLENLIYCIRSDDKIAIVCPTMSNTSNLQSINISYSNLEEMQKFAAANNSLNPDLWEERVRLCPPMAMLDINILNKTGFFDRYFVHIEFGDDDAGVVFRRNGFKQILQCDTFCHHFGSVTLGDAQRKNSTLEKSRKLFLNKHGFDPWGLGFCYDLNVIKRLDYNITGQVSILGIDAGMGSTPLQIKNELRHKGNKNTLLYNFTEDEQFMQDLDPYSDHFNLGSVKNLKSIYNESQFDYVYIGKMLEEYEDFKELLFSLKKIIKKDGQLVFQINNPYNILSLYELSVFKMPQNGPKLTRIDPFWLVSYLKDMFPQCDLTAISNEVPDCLSEYYDKLLKMNRDNDDSEKILKTTVFQFILRG